MTILSLCFQVLAVLLQRFIMVDVVCVYNQSCYTANPPETLGTHTNGSFFLSWVSNTQLGILKFLS